MNSDYVEILIQSPGAAPLVIQTVTVDVGLTITDLKGALSVIPR